MLVYLEWIIDQNKFQERIGDKLKKKNNKMFFFSKSGEKKKREAGPVSENEDAHGLLYGGVDSVDIELTDKNTQQKMSDFFGKSALNGQKAKPEGDNEEVSFWGYKTCVIECMYIYVCMCICVYDMPDSDDGLI